MASNKLTQTGLDMLQFTFSGNVTPPQWYKAITYENGKPDAIAVTLLSEIVYWHRPTEERDETTGKVKGYHRKYKADKLQRSYDSFVEQFGFTKNQVKAALKNLQDKGVIDLEFRTIGVNGQAMNNVLFIGLNVARLKEITYPSELINDPLCDSNCIGMELELETYTETTHKTTTDKKILEQPKTGCSNKPQAIQSALPVEDEFTTAVTVKEDELLFEALNRNRKAQRQRAMRKEFDTLQQKEKWRAATTAAASLYNGRHTEMLESWVTAALEKGIRNKAGVIAYVAACAEQQTARKTESLKVY